MIARMLCRKCKKITHLRVEDTHYTGGSVPSTILYVQTCCGGKSRWTNLSPALQLLHPLIHEPTLAPHIGQSCLNVINVFYTSHSLR